MRPTFYLWITAAVTVALFAFAAFTAPLQDVQGQARVIDGDTIVIAGQHVRLSGIDAPELGQIGALDGRPWDCGQAAKQHLIELIAAQPVYCYRLSDDRYGRWIGRCYVYLNGSEERNLSAEMVNDGYAVAYLKYSGDYFVNQSFAIRYRQPIWRSTCAAPEDWRRAHPR